MKVQAQVVPGLNAAENKFRSLTSPGGSSSPRAESGMTGERHEFGQLRLAGHANLHFTSEHMSRRGLFPLGCAGRRSPPLVCLFVTSGALIHSLFCLIIHLSVILHPSLFHSASTQKQPLSFLDI